MESLKQTSDGEELVLCVCAVEPPTRSDAVRRPTTLRLVPQMLSYRLSSSDEEDDDRDILRGFSDDDGSDSTSADEGPVNHK